MFDRAKSYNVSKACPNGPENLEFNSTFNRLEQFNKYNAHINLGFNRSNDDQELNDLDRDKNQDILDSTSQPYSLRSPKKLRKNIESDINYERGESIFYERKSIVPELETVIKWENLQVEVHTKDKPKKILDNISGEVNNLEIMAILGPSGAGKSTLLNTIAGKAKSYTGNVNFYSKDKRITFAYVPQNDQLSPYLTVKENLLFSSKLKNPPDTKHTQEVEFVLTAFNLWKAKNHYAFKCSGGERKRLSIGLEMISKPKILILDEPTSGLDSTTSYIVIEVLKTINKNTAIICTIHQPNSHLFQLFDKCYVLTSGKCIYNGTPMDLVDHLKNFGSICPNFTNPADFILEVANDVQSEKGLELIEKLSIHEQKKCNKQGSEFKSLKFDLNGNDKQINIDMIKNSDENNKQVQVYSKSSREFIDPISNLQVELQQIYRSSFKRKNNFINEFVQNVKKLTLSSIRDPQQTIFRFVNSIIFPIILRITINGDQAKESGCTFLPLNETHILTESTYQRYDRQLKGTQGAGLTFINLMFIFFSAMVPAVLVLSQHINVLRKEHMNNYYTLNSFFSAIIFVNFLLGFVYSTANTFSYFFFTGQIYERKKFLTFWFIIFLNSTLGDLFGLELSIIYPEQCLSAIVLGGFGGFALHTLSGFFVPIDTMREFVQKLSSFIFCRHVFEATIRTFYGHGRCKIDDHMIFDFDNIIDFVKYYNYENDANLQNIEEMPLKVRNALREKIWNKTAILDMAETMNDLEETELNKLTEFWDTRTSYILDSFNLNDPDVTGNLTIIILTILLSILMCYFTLVYKLNK